MTDSTVHIKAKIYRTHSFYHSMNGFNTCDDTNQVMAFTRLSIQTQMLSILWTLPKRLANAPISKSTNCHVRMELQLANTPLLTLLRCFQNTTNFGYIVRLILGSYDLQYKVLSLILIYTLRLFEATW
jgi:hypothetical protein